MVTAVLGAPVLHGHLLRQLRQGLVNRLAGAQRQRQPLLYPLHLLHPSAAPGLRTTGTQPELTRKHRTDLGKRPERTCAGASCAFSSLCGEI